MKKHRSKKQWQELFDQRKTFNGSTADFCRQHEIPSSSYYTRLNVFLTKEEISHLKQIKPAKRQKQANFIHITPRAKPLSSSPEILTFNLKTAELSLPANLEVQSVVAIIKGLLS